jgi:alpha-galactosidase
MGCEVDSSHGIITGAVAEPGEYRMKFSVSTVWQPPERDFKLVVGNTLALTPHMGWNSWYVWENHVTEQIMRDAADAMVETGMARHGYRYVNIDDCWSIKPSSDNPEINGEPRDAEGNLITNKRFPNMKGMVDYIHSKGLLAGTYTSPGPFTCAGHVRPYSFEEKMLSSSWSGNSIS